MFVREVFCIVVVDFMSTNVLFLKNSVCIDGQQLHQYQALKRWWWSYKNVLEVFCVMVIVVSKFMFTFTFVNVSSLGGTESVQVF
jgi:hypothetical protein